MTERTLAGALADLEAQAARLPWARDRRWRVASHVGVDRGVWVFDLHDLDAAGCRALVRAVRATPPPGGAVVFVHGVGRGSGPRGPVLVHVVRAELEGVGRLRLLTPGRTAWIHGAAPGWVAGEWGCATRLLFALLAPALAILVVPVPGAERTGEA